MSNNDKINQPFMSVINTGGTPNVQPHLHERLSAEYKVINLKNSLTELLSIIEHHAKGNGEIIYMVGYISEHETELINKAKELLK